MNINFIKNKPFTLHNLFDRANPKYTIQELDNYIKSEVKNAKLFLLGKMKEYGRKTNAYGTVPLHKMSIEHQLIVEKTSDNLTDDQIAFLTKISSPKIMRKILSLVERSMKIIIKEIGHCPNTSLISANFSFLFGNYFKEVIEKTFKVKVELAMKDDSKPDVYFPHLELKLEIKATATLTGWLGGIFSKRPFPTILISHDVKNSEYFVVMIPKISWPKSDPKKNWGGPSITLKNIRDDYPEKIILYGSIENDKMIRDSI